MFGPTKKFLLQFDQSQLSLGRGSRDYYLNETMFGTHIRAFTKYIHQVGPARKTWITVDFETALILLKDTGDAVPPELEREVKELVEFEKSFAKVRAGE